MKDLFFLFLWLPSFHFELKLSVLACLLYQYTWEAVLLVAPRGTCRFDNMQVCRLDRSQKMCWPGGDMQV